MHSSSPGFGGQAPDGAVARILRTMAAVEAATEKIVVTLPDGKPLELPAGATGADAAAAIGPGLAKAALAIRVDDELRDLSTALAKSGAEIGILTDRDPEALELIRHDAAHVMAEAVTDLYPGTKVTIGPPIDSGFYYDFEFPADTKISEDDLGKIEASMREHIDADEEFGRRDVPVAEALEIFRAQDQSFKVELIEDLVRDEGVETVSLYRNGPFEDLCRGPHGPSTGRIKAIKLSSVAGAYWRGDERRERLTRIYGTAFFSRKDLERHLQLIEEAKARDHRRLGPQLGIFMLRDEAPGMPFWLSNGTTLLRLIEAEVQAQLRKRGYREIATPQVLDEELWHRSGHWDNYRDEMYFMEDGERRFALRPMNCPGACLVYSSDRHSYRELPLRLAEFGRVSRNEREGVLHGLLRVRAFTQDDAHVYCTEEQITDEVASICEAIDELYARFGFEDVKVELSTRPEKSMGSDEQWAKAEAALTEALDRQGREYELNPGGGAFYGPKIDFHVTDALGRSWQCGTCQLDFQMPERFDLHYTGADDVPYRPVMIHRALLGSMERFAGILIEHYAGRFPVWLAPVQAIVLPISDRHNEYAERTMTGLREAGVRVAVDDRSESIGRKIRDAAIGRYPYMLVVGDREQEAGAVAVRSHADGELGAMSPAEFAGRVKSETGGG
jgi:threonyl-tRNA synthetase